MFKVLNTIVGTNKRSALAIVIILSGGGELKPAASARGESPSHFFLYSSSLMHWIPTLPTWQGPLASPGIVPTLHPPSHDEAQKTQKELWDAGERLGRAGEEGQGSKPA